MIKQFTKTNDFFNKIRALCEVNTIYLADRELLMINAMYEMADNMQVTLTDFVRDQLRSRFGITDSNLSTILHRLTEKGLIARQNKTIILNPMFKDLDQLTGVLVKFE